MNGPGWYHRVRMAENETPGTTVADATAKSRRLPGYLALAAALVLAIGVGAYLFASGGDDELPPLTAAIGTPEPNTGPLDPNRPTEGEMAPDFALRDARDPAKVVRLSDFRGKAVVLNFYYSDYRVRAWPTTMFIDKDGVVRRIRSGEVKEAQLVDYLAEAGVSYTP
jgi:hypothetical protein